MKFTRGLLVGLLSVIPTFLLAQTLELTTDSKGKMGYKDKTGNVIVPCNYTYAEPFSEDGFAVVGKGTKFGIIKLDGSYALPMDYSDIKSVRNSDFMRVKKGNYYGLIYSKTCDFVLQPAYSWISDFNCYGLAWVEEGGKIITSNGRQGAINGKMGVINKKGEILVTPKYKGLSEFSTHTSWAKQPIYGEADLLAVFGQWLTDTLQTDCQYLGFTNDATTTRKAGVMDIHGTEVMPMGLYTWVGIPVNGILRYWNENSGQTYCGYYDITKQMQHPMVSFNKSLNQIKFITHTDFTGNVAAVDGTQGWFFIDKDFNTLENGFSRMRYIKNTDGTYLAGIKKGGTTVYKNGTKVLTGTTYDEVILPDTDLGTEDNFAACKDGKWGLCDINGNELIAPTYDKLTTSRHGLYFTTVNGKHGAVDANGNTLIPAEYSLILYPNATNTTNIMCGSVGDTIFTNYNIKTKAAIGQYNYASRFKYNFAAVNPLKPGTKNESLYPGKRIIVDTDGNIIFSEPFPKDNADDVLQFVIDHNGNITQNLMKQYILSITRGSQRYSLSDNVPESGWDF